MKIKKLMSVSALCLVGVLGIGLLTGCNDEEDEKIDETTTDTTSDDTESGPASGLVFNNLFSMLNGFTFEGSIDIAYGDIEVGLEFNNGQAVIPLDMSDFSFDISKLAVGGDLTIVYDSYEITLGVTYLDSAVYVDYGEDSYWSEGIGDSVHFFMANSDIGDLISLFSSDDSEASSVDWEALFGLDLTNFDVMDLIYSLNGMTLTTSASGEPAFAVPLTSLGISDSLLIRTNNDSECTGLECTNLVMGEFTISIDLSLEAVTDLKVTTPEEISEYVDLACVNGIVDAVYDIMEYKYFHLTGDLSVGAWYGSLGDTATIETTVDMRIADDGTFTMLINCDIPI
ncbi:MAG: hypothetical protein LUB56_02195, partial [Coprobacillus sp.]|nr:hypothetical protein [Coprobacillus sp.]